MPENESDPKLAAAVTMLEASGISIEELADFAASQTGVLAAATLARHANRVLADEGVKERIKFKNLEALSQILAELRQASRSSRTACGSHPRKDGREVELRPAAPFPPVLRCTDRVHAQTWGVARTRAT